MKIKLTELFVDKYSKELLKKPFHSLRTGMLREIKKINNGVVPPRKWKFFDDLEFSNSDLNKEKKKAVLFENNEIS